MFSSCGEFLFFQFPEIKSTGSQLYPLSLTTVPLPLGPEPKTKLAPPKNAKAFDEQFRIPVTTPLFQDSIVTRIVFSLRVFAEVFFAGQKPGVNMHRSHQNGHSGTGGCVIFCGSRLNAKGFFRIIRDS